MIDFNRKYIAGDEIVCLFCNLMVSPTWGHCKCKVYYGTQYESMGDEKMILRHIFLPWTKASDGRKSQFFIERKEDGLNICHTYSAYIGQEVILKRIPGGILRKEDISFIRKLSLL